jgi:GTP cyclohydrolase IB
MTTTKLDREDNVEAVLKTDSITEKTEKSPVAKTNSETMPDVATEQKAQHCSTLDWVGMSKVALPIIIKDQTLGDFNTNARIETYVNLANPQIKGIHMSRLYLLLVEFANNNVLTIASLVVFLKEKLSSHSDISDRACLQIEFDYLINQPALKSHYRGWKDYPITIKATFDGKDVDIEMRTTVPYSSTCPCSSALARQLLQQAFAEDFEDSDAIDRQSVEKWLRSERGSMATPHSQRSYADVWVKLGGDCVEFPMYQLIYAIESILQTPVQTAVKREDEQEFARLNGANQMFCEDAARRLKNHLNQQSWFKDFWVRVEHLESLHAHDAVAITVRGLNGGYLPLLHR